MKRSPWWEFGKNCLCNNCLQLVFLSHKASPTLHIFRITFVCKVTFCPWRHIRGKGNILLKPSCWSGMHVRACHNLSTCKKHAGAIYYRERFIRIGSSRFNGKLGNAVRFNMDANDAGVICLTLGLPTVVSRVILFVLLEKSRPLEETYEQNDFFGSYTSGSIQWFILIFYSKKIQHNKKTQI